jgi:hypothetical protein
MRCCVRDDCADTRLRVRLAESATVLQSAKANGLEPYTSLRRVFTELPRATSVDDIERLLPYRDDLGELLEGVKSWRQPA